LSDQTNVDPMLAPLRDNGGPTFTHGLLPGSPAVDQGKNFNATATDQRGAGLLRIVEDPNIADAIGGDGSDVGAYEVQHDSSDQPPVADAGATVSLVISPNGTNATVFLNGSRSSDPDNDALQFWWYEAGAPIANGMAARTVLSAGSHSIVLVVSDEILSATNGIVVDVITAAEAMTRLAAMLKPDVAHAQSLAATLRAALASIDRSTHGSAKNQLIAFQNQVRAQVAPIDPALAALLIKMAQDIIDSQSGNVKRSIGRVGADPFAEAVFDGDMRLQVSAAEVISL
jgi:hypothetical protein